MPYERVSNMIKSARHKIGIYSPEKTPIKKKPTKLPLLGDLFVSQHANLSGRQRDLIKTALRKQGFSSFSLRCSNMY
jgi:hypothetical protein